MATMECLKVQDVKPVLSPSNHEAITRAGGKTGETTTEAPAVAEFLLALAHSHPTSSTTDGSKSKTSATAAVDASTSTSTSTSSTVSTHIGKKLGGTIVHRPKGAPVRARPLPEYLTLTRIPPLLFAEKLLRHENVPLEQYFPDQFDVEIASYQPSDHDIICGRGRGNFSHIGNQKLLDIIRERQDDYLKSNKRGKGALGKQILLEILMNGGRFVKLKDKEQNIWRVLSHKDVNTKIMHCIRDQINFQRKQHVSHSDDESRGTKNALDARFDASRLPPTKRLKGGATAGATTATTTKKLSPYLKMKYHDGETAGGEGPSTTNSSTDKHVPLSPKQDGGVSPPPPPPSLQFHSSSKALQGTPVSRLTSNSLAETMLARSQAEMAEAQTSEAIAAARLEASRTMQSTDGGLPEAATATAEGVMSQLAQKHALAQVMGQGMQPGLHGLIAKKEAELAALRAAMMGDANLAAAQQQQQNMLQLSQLLPQYGPNTLDLKQSMILARAELAAAGLRDPLADRLRLASMMNPATTESLFGDHLRQVAMQNGVVNAHPLSSLLNGLPPAQQLLPEVRGAAAAILTEGDAVSADQLCHHEC